MSDQTQNYYVILSCRGSNESKARCRLFQVEAVTPNHQSLTVGSVVTLIDIESHGYFATPANMEAYQAIKEEQAALRIWYRTRHL